MASTPEGVILTDGFRRAVAEVMGESARSAAQAFDTLLDPADLDRSFPAYAAVATRIVNGHRADAAGLAGAFVTGFRATEGVPGRAVIRAAGSVTPAQATATLLVSGPITVKKAIARGASVQQALASGRSQTVGAAQRLTVNAARETVMATVAGDDEAIGWARATDGEPCYFCAMLASRGPVYKGQGSADFRSHYRCGCVAVPHYSYDQPWPPGSQDFRDLWDSEIAGQFYAGKRSGRSGQYRTNEALKEWRRVYDRARAEGFFGTPTAAEVAGTVPVPDWRRSWEAAVSRLPEDRSKIARRDASAAEAAVAQAEALEAEAKAVYDELADLYLRSSPTVVDGELGARVRALTGFADDELTYATARRLTERAYSEAASASRVARYEATSGGVDYVDAKAFRSPGTALQAPGDTAMAHLDAVLDAGKALDDELERRVQARIASAAGDAKVLESARARVASAEKAVREAYEEILTSPRLSGYYRQHYAGKAVEELSDADLYVLRSEWAKHSGMPSSDPGSPFSALKRAQERLDDLVVKPGSPQYGTIVREEALSLLGEVRDVGNGVGSQYVGASELIPVMRWAESSYPTEWVNRLASERPTVTLKKVSRGYNANGSTIALSSKRVQLVGGTKMDDVAIHELGHSMEVAIPGLTEMEWAYFWRRALPDGYGPDGPVRPKKAYLYGSKKEVAVEDEWRELYSGKYYSDGYPPGWKQHYEIFTTGVESLLSGSPYYHGRESSTLDPRGMDREFRAFILGVLSAL